MKFQIRIDYSFWFFKDANAPYCLAVLSGTFTSDIVPALGDTMRIPFSIHSKPIDVKVERVIHMSAGKSGVLCQMVHCIVSEFLEVEKRPTQKIARKMKRRIEGRMSSSAKKFGLTDITLKFREPFNVEDYGAPYEKGEKRELDLLAKCDGYAALPHLVSPH